MWDGQQTFPRFFMSLTEFCLEQSKVTDMKTVDNASIDDHMHGGGEIPPSTGLTPDALPEVPEPAKAENLQSGVSTSNVPMRTVHQKDIPHWFALRTTYGREKKAYEYIISHNGTAFYPTLTTTKIINGKKKVVEVSRLPNILFAYGTEEDIKTFVYDNVNLPYLRFYYKHTHAGAHILKTPLIVPDNQIKSLQIICDKEGSDILVLQEEVTKFKQGEKVKIIEGDFAGVTGIVHVIMDNKEWVWL